MRELIPSRLAAVELVLRLGLGAVLLYACWDKLLHPKEFAAAVAAYRILPDALVNPAAVWLPWLELTLGVCLVSGIMAEGALALSTGLLAVFWAALLSAFARGIDASCGCFSVAEDPAEAGTGNMLVAMGRDAFILALAVSACEARRRLNRQRRDA